MTTSSPPYHDVLSRSNVHITGKGRQTVVLLHCSGGNPSMWNPLVPAFEERYQVVVLDLVGCCDSSLAVACPERHDTLRGHALDLLDVMRALALHDAIFVGHSVSAMIGVLAAIEAPERFARLVLISPSPRFLNGKDYAGGYEQQDLNELLTAMEADHQAAAAEPVLALTNSFVRTNPEIARHFARVTFFCDARTDRAFLTIPTLIVQAARDVLAPLAVGHYLNEHLVDSHIAIIDTSGHCPHLTAPRETLAAISAFLNHVV